MEALSDRYGWTPNEIRNMDATDLLAYSAIVNGRADAQNARGQRRPNPKIPTVNRKIRRLR